MQEGKGMVWKKLWWGIKPEKSNIETNVVTIIIKQWECFKEISKKGNLEENTIVNLFKKSNFNKNNRKERVKSWQF